MLMEARAGFATANVQANAFAVKRDAPDALASARAAPDKFSTNLTLSSAERRRFAARAGATISAAREQELTGQSMPIFAGERKTDSIGSHGTDYERAKTDKMLRIPLETATTTLSVPHRGGE